jgi:type I restriction enzyme S subunit
LLRTEAATNQACCAMIANPSKCHFLYLFYALKYHRAELLKLVVAGAQRNLSGGIIRSFKVLCPPLAVQKRIAAILSAYDDLIENNRRRITLLEEAARQLFCEWFVRHRFPGHEHIPINNGVPEGWESKCLGDVVEVKRGRNITREAVDDGAVPVVAGGLEPAHFHSVANAKGPVVTISASGANAGYVNIYLQDVWASDCSYISAEWTHDVYYYYCLLKYKQREIFTLQKGAAQPHVYPKDLLRLDVMSPPTRLIQYFREAVDGPFALIANLMAQNRQLSTSSRRSLPAARPRPKGLAAAASADPLPSWLRI